MELNLENIAEQINGTLIGDRQGLITGINSLDKAKKGDISFFYDMRYKEQALKTNATALVVSERIDGFPGGQIVVDNPKLAYARLAALFAPGVPAYGGISKDAVVEETAVIGKDVSIYPMVYVGKDAVIGDNVNLFPGVFIGSNVKIGNNTILHANVSVMKDCIIGEGVIIHAGCVIGSDGFGYVQNEGENVKVPQLGNVRIDDDVEIGANTTIDRAAHGTTHIKKGVKIDNLVQIAHNVVIGENSIVVAQTGISGSVDIGKNVILGGQVGIRDHVSIGDWAQVGSGAGVHKSIAKGEAVLGDPTMPSRLWMETRALIKKLPELNKKVKELEKKLKTLEGK
ncbi:MAG: UDP-3-O-(3-hydroxymyristoyl)glucosamine N-acyltransferase [Deltaproteobacteria bacterium]|nr:UDP-3-O-(3-hydroxymyristoyl)glucosamine N-acyltransferase [Deltaproteobacteria bacterium]